jgi:hypothetical protein
MDERNRLTFLAANYDNLRNLRFAPVYVLLIADPWIERLDWYHISDRTFFGRVGVALGTYVVWLSLMNAYYKRLCGHAESRPGQPTKSSWKDAAIVYIFFLPVSVSICLCVVLFTQHPPGMFAFLPFLLLLATTKGLLPSNVEMRRSYYLAADALALLIALALMIRRMPGHSFLYTYDETFFGIIMLVIATLDHVLLIRTFRQAPRDAYA